MSDDIKLCFGCNTYEYNICLIKPTIIRRGVKKMCPCITCLIKGMCTQECKEYLEYEDFIKDREDSIYNHITNKENLYQTAMRR